MTMLKVLRIPAALVGALIATAAAAQQPYSPELSCRSLEKIMKSRGAVVIGTSPTEYDRYVNSSQFCYSSQHTVAAWVPSADEADCFVGYTCRENDRESTGR